MEGRLPAAFAPIGTANAGGAQGGAAFGLPVGPGAATERTTLETLLTHARGAGVRGARLFGHAARRPPHSADRAHALAGLGGLVLLAAGVSAGLAVLGLVIVSAAARALGGPCLGLFLRRRPAWSLILRPLGPATRRVVAAPADRVRHLPALPRVVLGALLAGLLAPSIGAWAVAVVAAGLLAVALVAARLEQAPAPAPGGPEAEAARALVDFAAGLSASDAPDTAVLLCGGASADGGGLLSALDWWAVGPGAAAVDLVGTPQTVGDAAAALGRAGWRVRIVSPAELRSAP